MHFIVYKTTHLASGCHYIGVHKTSDLNDGYLGSGLRLSRAIKKYGRAAFTKEVLFIFDNPEEMLLREAELVTVEFCARTDTYNLIPGGIGGWWKRENADALSALSNFGHARQAELAAVDPHFRDKQRRALDQHRAKAHALRRARLIPSIDPDAFKGMHHTEATREIIRTAQQGSGNSQHGTLWVCRAPEGAKKIPATSLEDHLQAGWIRGRK